MAQSEEEMIGVAAFGLVRALLSELEPTHPGLKQRVLAKVKVNFEAEIGKNSDSNKALLEVVSIL